MLVKELFFKLGIKSNQQDFKKAENGMQKITDFAKKAAVAFASFKLGQWIRGIAQEVAILGDRFDKMEARTGVAAQTLQQLGFAAELTGSDINTVEIAIRTLQRTSDEAAAGVATYKDEYDRLGVSIKDANGQIKTFDQLLPEVAAGLKKLKTDTEKAAVAQKIFGRSGTQLLPLLKSGSDEIQNMMKEFRELGGVIDKDLQKQSAQYIDNQTKMNTVFQGLKNVVGKQLIPVFNTLSENFIEWFKQNRKWIALRIGSIFKSLGRIIKNVSGFFGSVINNVVVWISKLSPLQKAIMKVSTAVAGLAIILSLPAGSILLLIGLIALLIDDFQTWQEGGESVIGTLIKKMENFLGLDVIKTIKGWVSSFVQQIKRMFAPITMLVKFIIDIFILGLPKAWEKLNQRFDAFIMGMFDRFWAFVDTVKTSIIKVFSFIWDTVGKDTKEFFVTLWNDFTDILDRLWTKIVNWSKRIVDKITAPFRKVKSLVSGIFGDEEKTSAVRNVAEAAQTEPILNKTISEPVRRMINRTSNNSVSVTVNAAPGMNEQKLAKEVSKQVQGKFDQMNRAAIQAFVPAGG